MLHKLLDLLRGRPVRIDGTRGLPDGQARVVDVGDPLAGDGRSIVLCRVAGELHALDSRCPHEGGRIIGGPLVDGSYALCPLHNYRFDPRDGRVVVGACKPARTYRLREDATGADLWL